MIICRKTGPVIAQVTGHEDAGFIRQPGQDPLVTSCQTETEASIRLLPEAL